MIEDQAIDVEVEVLVDADPELAAPPSPAPAPTETPAKLPADPWKAFKQLGEEQSRSLRVIIADLQLDERGEDHFAVCPRTKSVSLVRPQLLAIEGLLSRAAGKPVRVEIVEPSEDAPPPVEAAATEQAQPAVPTRSQLKEQAAAHPLVQAALEAFDAELLDAHPKPKADPDA